MRHDAYPFARERIAQLIDSAHKAVGQIRPHQMDGDSAGLFKATWTTSRAAGFLEAFALVDPALAGEMLPDFESVAQLVDRLRAAGHEIVTPRALATLDRQAADRRIKSRLEGSSRRVAIRRMSPERRVEVRRQLDDRRRTLG